MGQQLVQKGMQQRACHDVLPSSCVPAFPPLRTFHRVRNKTRLLLLQIIKNRRSIFTVHVHLIHNGKSGLKAILDVTADLRGSARLLSLERASGREGRREDEVDLVRGRKQEKEITNPEFCDDRQGRRRSAGACMWVCGKNVSQKKVRKVPSPITLFRLSQSLHPSMSLTVAREGQDSETLGPVLVLELLETLVLGGKAACSCVSVVRCGGKR